MRVAFVADPLYNRIAAGSTRYAGQLVRHLESEQGVDLQLFSLYPKALIHGVAQARGYPAAESFTGLVPRPLQYLLWHTVGWTGPAARALRDADVVHAPAFLIPPRRERPLVVTVLDLAFLLFPRFFGCWLRIVAGKGMRRAVRDADAFIAISDHTAQDLMRHLGVSSKRIYTVPLAAEAQFVPVDDPAVRQRYGIQGDFLLYLGTLEPRKNLGVLLRAFAAMERPDVKLVLAGTKGWLYQDIFDTAERLGLGSRVIFPGYVAAEDLPALISAARAFVYPTIYEGFGLPVLEAMQCGTPVITTNTSSLPEVAGDAALMVAPYDVEGLARAMLRLWVDQPLHDELREKGFEQAARFSWRKTAEQTAEVYHAVAR